MFVGRELPEHGKFAQIQRVSETRTDMRREARKLLELFSRYFGHTISGNMHMMRGLLLKI